MGLADALRARIERDGPLRLDDWMAACNAHYYATRDPLGADFTTAPEISQMFGELVGAWVADLWDRAGRVPFRLIELGPGRGTLMADALRVLGRAGVKPEVALVETSPVLRAAQAERVQGAAWFDTLDAVPDDLPMMLIANEFFDALPVRQVAEREVAVAVEGQGFAAATIAADIVRSGEFSLASEVIVARIAARLHITGGAALIIDYGHDGGATDTLQAVRDGQRVSPFTDPGEADLTAHVDFAALANAAGSVRVSGPVPQGVWLTRLGIEARAAALKARASTPQAAAIEAALVRLTAPQQMGALFRVMALTSHGWPEPAGFAA